MQWILLSLVSAVFLGIYDLTKKYAVHGNAVPPVLLLNVTSAATICSPFIVISWLQPDWLKATPFFVTTICPQWHALIFCKAVLVGTSWTLALFALKHLPLSIAAPIRSTSPLWTVLIAATLLYERPTEQQWSGIAIIILAFSLFSRVGRTEGIHFRTNRWVIFMIIATLLGSISSLYDKFLLQNLKLQPATLQAWFSIYLVPVMLPLTIRWFRRDRKEKPFQFRWSIPMIAVTLLTADFLYFIAVSTPDALISIVSPIRRTSVIIPFLFGVTRLAEKNWKRKLACIALMLLGVWLVSR